MPVTAQQLNNLRTAAEQFAIAANNHYSRASNGTPQGRAAKDLINNYYNIINQPHQAGTQIPTFEEFLNSQPPSASEAVQEATQFFQGPNGQNLRAVTGSLAREGGRIISPGAPAATDGPSTPPRAQGNGLGSIILAILGAVLGGILSMLFGINPLAGAAMGGLAGGGAGLAGFGQTIGNWVQGLASNAPPAAQPALTGFGQLLGAGGPPGAGPAAPTQQSAVVLDATRIPQGALRELAAPDRSRLNGITATANSRIIFFNDATPAAQALTNPRRPDNAPPGGATRAVLVRQVGNQLVVDGVRSGPPWGDWTQPSALLNLPANDPLRTQFSGITRQAQDIRTRQDTVIVNAINNARGNAPAGANAEQQNMANASAAVNALMPALQPIIRGASPGLDDAQVVAISFAVSEFYRQGGPIGPRAIPAANARAGLVQRLQLVPGLEQPAAERVADAVLVHHNAIAHGLSARADSRTVAIGQISNEGYLGGHGSVPYNITIVRPGASPS